MDLTQEEAGSRGRLVSGGMTQSQLSLRKLNQAVRTGPWEGAEPEARRQERGLGGSFGEAEEPPNALFPGGHQCWESPSPLSHPDAPSSSPTQGPLSSQRCSLPPPYPASHALCVRSSSGTPREGPAGGTGGSGGPGGSLGSRGRRRKLYSAVPGRSFMAVKSYQAQAEGEISLSKGEKIKGTQGGSRACAGLGCGGDQGKRGAESRPFSDTRRISDLREPCGAP